MNQSRERAGRTTTLNGLKTWITPALLTGMLACASGAAAAADAVSPQAWKEIETAGQKEGRLNIYGALANTVVDRLRADFTKMYPGISTTYVRQPSGLLLGRLEQERKSGIEGGDFLINTEIAWSENKAKEGLLKLPVGPSLAAWPKEYLVAGAVPILAAEPIGMVYNTNLVKTTPATYQDLLKPEYKGGKMGVLDIVATTVVAFYDWLEKDQGPDYLAKFAAQEPRIYASNPVGLQNAAAGEIMIATFMNPAMAIPLIRQGAPIKLLYPPRVFGFQYVGTAFAWGKHPNAAVLFLDYLMSRRGQGTWMVDSEGASPLPNIPGSIDIKTISPYDPDAYPADAAKAYKAKWDRLFKK